MSTPPPLQPLESKKGLQYQCTNPPTGRTIEIGTDEVGRGPLFGRTYAAAVVLPPLHCLSVQDRAVLAVVRDSKSVPRTKIKMLAADVRRVVRTFQIEFVEADEIDAVNIRQAVISAMRKAVCDVARQLLVEAEEKEVDGVLSSMLYVFADGKDLPSPVTVDDHNLPVVAEAKADARYMSVACAAILAKDAHDAYILELCARYPALSERYSLHQNMGYGTKAHMEGLVRHGPTFWHRQSFRPVREALVVVAKRAKKEEEATNEEEEEEDPLGVPRLRYFSRDGGGGGKVFDDGVDDDEEE